jgi:DNA polymerase-1
VLLPLPTRLTALGCGDACFYKTPKVGTKGPVDSPFVIVGESPGINEVIEGAPFVGPSGEVIHETLKRQGIDSLLVKGIEPYWTNTIHCLPRRKDMETQSAACLRCRPRLLREIRAHPRKLILALGAFALQSLTGDFSLKITRERGKLFPSDLAEFGILAAVHPAFLLRGGGNYQQFERDVRYAVNLMKHGNSARLLPNGTEFEVADNWDKVWNFLEVLRRLPEGTKVACDIETTGFNHLTDRILYLGIQYEPQRSMVVPGEYLSSGLLSQRHLRYVWHNGKFDIRVLRSKGYLDARVDDDTLLQSYALNERRGIHDLDQVASDWLGSVNHKHMVAEWYKGFVTDPSAPGGRRRRNLGDAPPELVERYVALDINDTYHLDEALLPQVLDNKDLKRFYKEHLLPGSEYLTKVELNGMVVARDWVLQNHTRLTEEMGVYAQELNTYAARALGYEINPNSWMQVAQLLYGGLKLSHPSSRTDKDTIEELYRTTKHPALKALKNYRLAQKAHGTYVKPLMFGADRELLLPTGAKTGTTGTTKTKNRNLKETVVYPDGKVHTSYLLHGTPTSRLASRDPNVQNVPRDPRLRGMFRAREGYGILEVDYSQAELRSLAALSRCPDLMEIFQQGKDLHNEFTSFLFGPGWTRENKMSAKAVNFGIVYGREAPSIASDPDLNKTRPLGEEITIEEAQSWIDGWSKRFPVAWAFIQRCRQAPANNETIVTCFGNKKRPGVVSRDKLHELQNESANFPHQSIASNLTVRAGIELIDPLRVVYDSHIINTVHDCLVIEVPLDAQLIKKVATFVTSKMEEIPQRYAMLKVVPFKAEAEFGHHWGNLVKLKELEALKWALDEIPDYIPAH